MRLPDALRRGLLPAMLLALTLLVALPGGAYPERTGYDRAFPAYGGGDFVLADLTGDGRVDLAAVDDRGGVVWVHPGTKLGIPGDPPGYAQLPGVADLEVSDLDGDGGPEVVALGSGGAWRLRWGAMGGVSAEPLGVGGGERVALGDLNGDGRSDLAILNGTEVRVHLQRPSSNGSPPSFSQSPDRAFVESSEIPSVLVGDVDGDGWDDLVYATAHETVLYRQQGGALAAEPVRTTVPASDGNSIGLGLLQGAAMGPGLLTISGDDGAYGAAVLWRWNGTGLQVLETWTGPYTARMAIGDVDDDGQPDVAVVRTDGGVAFIHLPTPARGSQAVELHLDPPNGTDGTVQIGDANADGIEDVVLRTRNPNMFYVYLQEDAPPTLVRAIPSTFAVNRGRTTEGVIDLDDYYADDHHRLTFAVVHESAPDCLDATVNGSLLDFEAADWLGSAEFRVSAWDGNPSHAPVESNTFSVLVNDPPVITSQPPKRATAGEPYEYVVEVNDFYPEGDPHAFALLEGPEGMTLDAATGLLAWTPGDGQVGSHRVTVEVRDGFGGVAVQSYAIVVASASGGLAVPLLAASAIAMSSAFVAAAALLNENAKYGLFLLFVPLYSKIKRERVLDHFVRGQIYGYIQANPGEHYNAIKDALDLTNGSLAHHLRTLEREQFIQSRRYGLYRRFYPMHMRLPEDGAFEPNEIQRTILDVIRQRPGITQKEVAERLGLTPPTVNYHINILSGHRVVRVDREGRSTHLTLVEGRP